MDDHGDLAANQIGHQFRQPIELIFGPAIFDRDVLAFDIAGFFQALANASQTVCVSRRAMWGREPNHRHRRLLRPRQKRPRRSAAEKGDELTALHYSVPPVRPNERIAQPEGLERLLHCGI